MSTSTGPPAEWSVILIDAVSKPGVIADAYSRFWYYSVGNQFLAMWQCHERGIEPGPINTFLGWKDCGRFVKKGEKAITLCMPVTVKAKKPEPVPAGGTDEEGEQETFTRFVYRPHWFVLCQTEGKEYVPQSLPEWQEERALASLGITRIAFDHPDGNVQGYATGRTVTVSPIAFEPHRTLFHELAHVVLGHTDESRMVDEEGTPRNLLEVEAESVALICGESLGLTGAEFSRGYIQHYLRSQTIPEKSAHRIFKAADTILRAGRPAEKEEP